MPDPCCADPVLVEITNMGEADRHYTCANCGADTIVPADPDPPGA